MADTEKLRCGDLRAVRFCIVGPSYWVTAASMQASQGGRALSHRRLPRVEFVIHLVGGGRPGGSYIKPMCLFIFLQARLALSRVMI